MASETSDNKLVDRAKAGELLAFESLVNLNGPMDWDAMYQKGEVFWDRGESSPPMRQYLEHHAVRGRALVPGCGRGHEVALAVAHGMEATGLLLECAGG